MFHLVMSMVTKSMSESKVHSSSCSVSNSNRSKSVQSLTSNLGSQFHRVLGCLEEPPHILSRAWPQRPRPGLQKTGLENWSSSSLLLPASAAPTSLTRAVCSWQIALPLTVTAMTASLGIEPVLNNQPLPQLCQHQHQLQQLLTLVQLVRGVIKINCDLPVAEEPLQIRSL